MYVDFVSDDHFKDCVRHVLEPYNNATQLKISLEEAIDRGDIFMSSLFSNVVDPFKMTFEIEKIGITEWVKKEILRQLDKSVEQKMGEFHQKLLGGVSGWEDLQVGNEVDLKNEEENIFIEIKNKFNTCSSDALKGVRRKLEEITRANHEARAYWAYVIANSVLRSGEDVWIKKGFNKIDNVKKVWGANVYELVTGSPDSLEEVYSILPKVINDVLFETEAVEISVLIDEIIVLLEPHLQEIQNNIFNIVFRNR
ncbi:MAG: Eco47II family restriction endonuclease [Calditrichaeota bacterium]|nr:MAG: Eco47II family restriction endonuclease [Calditrichota bacterium]MBL1206493.1 Eco47II family restriction endonuclease [Calditrichota bacterium]NOG46320.1 Eco47II family restriction endonuclease [Calditrichota bacterium]